MLFLETITASQFREKIKEYLSKITGSNVIQVLHRGQPVRVIMTQEHYLNLVSRLAAYETKIDIKNAVPHVSATELIKSSKAKLEKILGEDEEETTPKRKRAHG